MLGRELQQVVGHVIDLSVGGHGGGGGEGPAGAAPSLVSDAGDDSLLPPVHLGWKVLQSDLSPLLLEPDWGGGPQSSGVETTAGVGLNKLLPAVTVIKKSELNIQGVFYLRTTVKP